MTTVASCRLIASALAVLSTLGCEPVAPPPSATPASPTAAPTRAARSMPLVGLPDGAQIELELASTPEEISRGLMFRPTLAENRGMLFLFGEERMPSFWMKNTLIPLDIVFLDSAGEVVDLVSDAQPCRVEPCPQYVPKRPAAAVLELGAGAVRRHRIAEGEQLVFDGVPAYPSGT